MDSYEGENCDQKLAGWESDLTAAGFEDEQGGIEKDNDYEEGQDIGHVNDDGMEM